MLSSERESEELRRLAIAHRRGRVKRFTDDQKRMIVEAYLKDHVPLVQLSEKFNVSRVSIWRWISTFADGNGSYEKRTAPQGTIQSPMPMPQKNEPRLESPEEELARLRAENKRLEEALKMAEWSNHAKDVMIDLAEKTFNIPIRKKSGAKQ